MGINPMVNRVQTDHLMLEHHPNQMQPLEQSVQYLPLPARMQQHGGMLDAEATQPPRFHQSVQRCTPHCTPQQQTPEVQRKNPQLEVMRGLVSTADAHIHTHIISWHNPKRLTPYRRHAPACTPCYSLVDRRMNASKHERTYFVPRSGGFRITIREKCHCVCLFLKDDV